MNSYGKETAVYRFTFQFYMNRYQNYLKKFKRRLDSNMQLSLNFYQIGLVPAIWGNIPVLLYIGRDKVHSCNMQEPALCCYLIYPMKYERRLAVICSHWCTDLVGGWNIRASTLCFYTWKETRFIAAICRHQPCAAILYVKYNIREDCWQ